MNLSTKRILFIFSLFLFAAQSYSQSSMTDEQVVRFVKEQQEKGIAQEQIVTRLLQRGVTPQQLRNIRKKYQAQQEQLGAVDLVGQSNNRNASRQRIDKQKENEESLQKNNYMIRSQIRGKNGIGNYSYDEKKAMLNDDIGFFDIDSVLYYKNLLKDENEVFGRNIFSQENLTFQPNMNLATPTNYILGAGDHVIIDVWGSAQESYEGDISPDGVVVIEGVGPIHLGGLSVSAATARLRSVLGRYYSDCKVSLSVGSTRSIQVQVVGEVNMPGTFTLSSLSTSFNALYAAGGISDIGTLRDIKVYRGGRQIASIDVYDYLLHGNVKGDVRLLDNDVIVVGPYDCLVNVRGKVKRPMFYEMKSHESVATLIEYAGGFAGDAYKKNVRLIRKNGNEYSIHTIDEFDMKGFTVSDADSVFVDSVVARFSNM
ncbi:MAG: SLBB domain-containing protein, partial [Bacteroidaceae bacterium]|nr:SLBB domain-containing protein [Bacteroidaceae bacterium]